MRGSDEPRSGARIAFDRYLRTGLRLAPAGVDDAIERKYNHNHDALGSFASAPGDGTASLNPVPGYPETGKDAWRKANDAIILRAAQQFNAANGLKPGDPRYMDPQLMKAWAMVESGGDKAAFLSDPFQVNKPLDWDKDKAKIGLTYGQTPTPELSASAALQWLDKKGHETISGVTRYYGLRTAFQRYNKNPKIEKNGQPHWANYASKILLLGGN